MEVTGVEAVVFDAYGTLFDIAGDSWAPPDVVATMRDKQLQYSWLTSLMGDYVDFRELTRWAIEYALARHRMHADVESIMARQLEIRLFPEVIEALDRIRKRRRLAVLSNGHPDSLDALLRNAGIRDQFEAVVSAHEVRVFKPAPAVYERMLNVLGCQRERVVFVSANSWDAGGAARCGLRVTWVNRSGLPAERIGGQRELVVADLIELAESLS